MRQHIPGWTLVGTLAIAGMLGGLSAFPAHAGAAQDAEAKAPDTYFVTVRDGVQMRCRPASFWYVVSTLEQGQVLRVAGERDGWMEVEYPPGTPAVTRIERVEIRDTDDGEQVAVLTRDTSLYAYDEKNQTRDDSYTMLFARKNLGAGTRLPVIGTVDRRGGGLGGYLVMPPRGAVGYVQPLSSDVRIATQDEIDAFLAESGWGDDGEADEIVMDNTDDGASETDTPSNNETRDPEDDSSDETPAEDVDDNTSGDASDENKLDVFERAERELDGLNDAFRRLIEAPLDEAEVTPLIEAYESFAADLPDELAGQGFGEAVESYVALLRVREQLQGIMRDARALEDRVAATPDMAVVERSASLGYTSVGRLMPSLIYNGDRLPQLYRVVSVDSELGRTLAYVAPVDGINLGSMLGSIVGVRGEATTEQGRRVPILRPTVVDVLRSGE